MLMEILITQSLKNLGTTAFEKYLMLTFRPKFSVSIICPSTKSSLIKRYMRRAFDVLFIHTKLFLDDISGSWETETAYFVEILTMWPLYRLKVTNNAVDVYSSIVM